MKFSKFNLEKNTALITGGVGLLGIHHAKALLESGARVVITDIDESKLNSCKEDLLKDFNESKVFFEVMNVTNENSIFNTLNKLTNMRLHIDILINNAAIDPKVQEGDNKLENSRLENFDLNDWNHQLSVGLTGAFLCSKIFGQKMANSNKSGVILNIASDLSVISPDQRLYKKNGYSKEMQPVKPITYSVIKSGLIGLTMYLSTYWSEQGVRCNALSPGGIKTNQSEEFVEKLSKLIPMSRMAEKDEYKSAIQFLCSDASSYMNGQNIIMDGGRSVW